jgi:uncharacterized membrane protein
MNKGRLEAFSDGMFAIIITIMVLDIKAPHGNTFKDLLPQIPIMFCYLQSFWFVANYWSNHHHLLHTANKVTGTVLVANLNLLFFLSMIPFVTGWVSETDFAPEPVIVYAIALLIPGFMYTILLKIIEKHNPWSEPMKKAMKRQEIKAYISIVLYVAAIPVAFKNTYISEAMFLVVALVWIFPDSRIEKAMAEN